MKKVDFLFVYEVKVREIENICLLKYELEKRGYSVEFINTWYYQKKKIPKIDAVVVISFALFDDDVYNYICSFVHKFQKLINLQWEQLGTNKSEEDTLSRFFIKGLSKEAVHLAWGEKTFNRLNSCGIDKKNIKITGHITMDFLNESFLPYYMSKEKLFDLYNIPLDKKICLFISSFTLTNLSNIQNTKINEAKENAKKATLIDIDDFVLISTITQKNILNWITSILKERDDLVFIYRPHPAEYIPDENISILKNYKNFFVISEHSVRQWIIACDVITTWYSTSLAEVYFAKKNCYILRPNDIPTEMDLALYKNAAFVTNYNSFKQIFDEKLDAFPADENLIKKYYAQDNNFNYIKICDVFEEVYKNDFYNAPLPKDLLLGISVSIRIKQIILSTGLMRFFTILFKKYSKRLQNIYNLYYEIDEYTQQMQKKNYASEEEINLIINKIKNCLVNK